MKTNKVYKEAFDKAFSVALKELSKYNCNNLADMMLFSEYMSNRTCSLGELCLKENFIIQLMNYQKNAKQITTHIRE